MLLILILLFLDALPSDRDSVKNGKLNQLIGIRSLLFHQVRKELSPPRPNQIGITQRWVGAQSKYDDNPINNVKCTFFVPHTNSSSRFPIKKKNQCHYIYCSLHHQWPNGEFTQFIPQLIRGSCVVQNDIDYNIKVRWLDQWHIQSQYLWTTASSTVNGCAGDLLPVSPGDRIDISISYILNQNGIYSYQLQISTNLKSTSKLMISTPFMGTNPSYTELYGFTNEIKDYHVFSLSHVHEIWNMNAPQFYPSELNWVISYNRYYRSDAKETTINMCIAPSLQKILKCENNVLDAIILLNHPNHVKFVTKRIGTVTINSDNIKNKSKNNNDNNNNSNSNSNGNIYHKNTTTTTTTTTTTIITTLTPIITVPNNDSNNNDPNVCKKDASNCAKECNFHGKCINGSCVCKDGWKGILCAKPTCSLCGIHGTCSPDGMSCCCSTGWTGEKCNIFIGLQPLKKPLCTMDGLCICPHSQQCQGFLPDLIIPNDHHHMTKSIVEYNSFDNCSCAVHSNCIHSGRRKLLRFSSIVINLGSADLFIGNPTDYFPSTNVYDWHTCHDKPHFRHWLDVRLINERNQIIRAQKIGNSVIDSVQVIDMEKGKNRHQYSEKINGLSIGCGRLHNHYWDCQWIDITDIPLGNYQLEIEVNPSRMIKESNYENNIFSINLICDPPCGIHGVCDFGSSCKCQPGWSGNRCHLRQKKAQFILPKNGNTIGIVYLGTDVLEVALDSEAAHAGVRKGWKIISINGIPQPPTSTSIAATIQLSQRNNERTTITFADNLCIPQCNGKNCGPDGCGGSCGACIKSMGAIEMYCTPEGACKCQKQCQSKECGNDGCGSHDGCGICLDTETCVNGKCICQPVCHGDVCDWDGCCGYCNIEKCDNPPTLYNQLNPKQIDVQKGSCFSIQSCSTIVEVNDCFCEPSCDLYGDCCSDYYSFCGLNPQPSSFEINDIYEYFQQSPSLDIDIIQKYCSQWCGSKHIHPVANCYCDFSCIQHGDCCSDYWETCEEKQSVYLSCEGKCGMPIFDDDWYFPSCACDNDCQVYNDCCLDFEQVCSVLKEP